MKRDYIFKFFIKDTLITAGVCFILLILLLIIDWRSIEIWIVPFAVCVIYGITYSSLKNKKEDLGTILYFATPLPVILYLIFMFPWLKLESLLFLPSGFTSLIFIRREWWAKFTFTFYFSLAIIFQLYESYFAVSSGGVGYADIVNHIVIFTIISLLGTSVISLASAFNLYIKKLLDKERERAQSQALYGTLFEYSFDAVFFYDTKKDKIVRANSAFHKMFESTKDEVFTSEITPRYQANGRESKDMIIEYIGELFRFGKAVRLDFLHQRIGGEVFETETTIIPNTGNSDEIIIMIKDISELKKAEKELQKSRKRYKGIIDSSPSGISIFDRQGNHIYASSKSFELFGLEQEDFSLGLNVEGYFFPDEAERLKQFLGDTLEGKTVKNTNLYKARRKDGSAFMLETHTNTADQKSGDSEEVVIVFNDVSERINQEKTIQEQVNDLNKKNEELKKYIDSNLQLENFAYIASHDLQAPLRTVISFTQLLQKSLKERINENEKEYMDFVISGTRNMQNLISALLTFSRVNTTKRNIKSVNIQDLLEDIILELRSNIQEIQPIIEVTYLPVEIMADELKIRRLFQNLITNALKFIDSSRQPIVQIDCKETRDFWQFSVTDNGIGIDAGFYEKIFLLFKRLHTQTQFEGTGIGLALCKKLVDQHDGEIFVESQLGVGSTFYFTVSKNLEDVVASLN